jgi:hypothetical protein
MPKKFIKLIAFFIILHFFCSLFLIFPIKKAAAANESMPKLTMPNLQIKIPKLQLTSSSTIKCKEKDEKGNSICKLPWIGEYISAIYKYAIGIVGILATVVMMIGGLIWLTAGGNQTRIGEAKSWITASVSGLVIALCSYLILYQINPELINLKPIKVAVVIKGDEITPGTLSELKARSQLNTQLNFINVRPACRSGQTIGCVTLSGIRQETIDELSKLRKELTSYYAWKIGDYEYIIRDNAINTVYITGGTEGCKPEEKAVHTTGVYSHCNGYKIDLSPHSTKLNEYIVKNYPRIKDRIEQNGNRTAQYQAPSGAIYAAEFKNGKFDHWDVLVK